MVGGKNRLAGMNVMYSCVFVCENSLCVCVHRCFADVFAVFHAM